MRSSLRFMRLTLLLKLFFSNLSLFEAIESYSIHEIKRRRDNPVNSIQHHGNGFQKDVVTIDSSSTDDVDERYFQQRLDHFEVQPHPSSSNDIGNKHISFSQRYFYSSRFVDSRSFLNDVNVATIKRTLRSASSSNSTSSSSSSRSKDTFAFLCVGGEGPSLTKHVLTDSVHCTGDMIELASKLHNERKANVHLFALEHRYYGNSYPEFSDGSSPVSNKNLVYLSSRQALMDIANFVQFAKYEYGLENDVKFVTFGGSYPGMMAAWSRLKFPHLIYASVSNSAPVQVVLDFYQYYDVVSASLKNPLVGGSEECYDVVKSGHEKIISELEKDMDEARMMIASVFNICGGSDSLIEKKNLNAFLGDGVIQIPAQENDPSCEHDLCNIEKVCKSLTSSSSRSPMDKLASIARTKNHNECIDINWEDMISFLSSSEAIVEGTRSWLWQTCTEVGFYQTCHHNTTCPYGRGYHTLEQDYEICERAFGINRELIPENVQETMNNYGGWNMAGSRILSINGDIDPWSALSMNMGGVNTTELPSYWSIGASHHFWTHKVKDSDDERIIMTRELIHGWVTNILYSSDD